MKRSILLLAVLAFSFMGFSNSASAAVECDTIVIDCGDGPVTNGLICGSNGRETVKAARELADSVCN